MKFIGQLSSRKFRSTFNFYLPMWVLGLVVMIDSADQGVIRGVGTQIEHAFHLNDFQLSLLGAAATILNASITMPAGYLADRWNRMKSIGYTVVIWSIISAMSAGAFSFASLIIIRGLLGFGQGITEPSANSVIADFYKRDGRGLAFSVQQILSILGTGLGVALSSYIGARFGWRYAYIVVSGPGLIVAFMCFRLREPSRGESDYKELGLEKHEEMSRKKKFFENGVWNFTIVMVKGLYADLVTIVKIKTLRLTLVGVASILFTVNAIGFWLPVYYQRIYHVSQTASGNYFLFMLIFGGIPGFFVGGKIADKFIHRYPSTRVVQPGLAAILSVTVFIVSFTHVPLLATIVLNSIGFFIGTTAVAPLRAGLADVTPGELRGTGFGAFNLTTVIFGSAFAPSLVGFLSSSFGNDLRTAFLIVLPPVYIGAIFLLVAKRYIQKDTIALLQRIVELNQELPSKTAEDEFLA